MRSPTARFLVSAVLVAALVGACSGAGGASSPSAPQASDVPTATSAATAPGPSSVPASADPGGGSSEPSTPAISLDQAWATAELTDVATGEMFRIADLAGRPIILETMAIWCSSCLAQQQLAYEALADVDPASVAYILVDVDPSETAEALAAYRDRNGFTGTYVVASTEMARALAAEFGDQVLNPPATPMILVGTDGTVTLTPFAKKSADDIRSLLDQHGA